MLKFLNRFYSSGCRGFMVFVERLFFGFNLGGSGKVVVIWGSFRMFVRFLGVFFKKV